MIRALVAHFAVQNVVHFAYQGVRRERLLEEVPSVVENEHSFGVTGHQHHPHIRSPLLQPLRQLRPRYPRHRHIGKQQLDRSGELAFDL